MANLEFDPGNDYAPQHPEREPDLAAMDSDLEPASQRRSTTSGPALSESETPAEAPNLREQVIWSLREQGYRDREIAEVMGITRQRVSQIERRLVARAMAAKTSRNHLAVGAPKALRRHAKVRVHAVTSEDFERRLNTVNRYYDQQLQRLLKGGYNRQKSSARAPMSPLFWKVWPLIEGYQLAPFSFSKLLGDFPALAQEAHLAQLLSRLRKKGLLQAVGSVRVKGQNLPEVLMAQTPIEKFIAPKIQKLVAGWARDLKHLNSTFCPDLPANRLARSTESIRNHLIKSLFAEGRSAAEIENLFFANRKQKPSNFDRLEHSSPSVQPSLGQH